jgi:DNA-3-methyladenine glycosylase
MQEIVRTKNGGRKEGAERVMAVDTEHRHMVKVLRKNFFDRPVRTVAKELLGKYLVRKIGGKTRAFLIVETEAYAGPHDKASHARHGKTERNAAMFAEAGTIYVYFTYGMHWMLNLVTGKDGEASAVLVRGLLAEDGEAVRLDGPAKLTKHLHIDRSFNGKKLGRAAGLWVEDRGVKVTPREVKTGPRVGVEHAGEWAKKPWRYLLARAGARE